MKVKELIKLLSELDQEKEIYTSTYDDYHGADVCPLFGVRHFDPNGIDEDVSEDDTRETDDFYVIH